MNYPPKIRKEVKNYLTLQKKQQAELKKLRALEQKLRQKLETLGEQHSKASTAVRQCERAHNLAQAPIIVRLTALATQHGLNVGQILLDINNKPIPVPEPQAQPQHGPN